METNQVYEIINVFLELGLDTSVIGNEDSINPSLKPQEKQNISFLPDLQ